MAGEASFDWSLDSPWRRLPVTLPGAVLVGLLGLWGASWLISGDAAAPQPITDTLTLDAQLIELPPPRPAIEQPRRPPAQPRDEHRPEPPAAEVRKRPASLEAPPAPSAAEWQLASTYTLKNSKRYRNAWGQQVRSQMGTAVEGPDQGLVRLRITINPDGSLAQLEELWSTSAKASELARKAIQSLPPLPPTPTGKPLVFTRTIAFLPYETGWPPSYRNDCLPDPPAFRNPFAWDGQSPRSEAAPPPEPEERDPDCHPSEIIGSFEEEEAELTRQIERNRYGR